MHRNTQNTANKAVSRSIKKKKKKSLVGKIKELHSDKSKPELSQELRLVRSCHSFHPKIISRLFVPLLVLSFLLIQVFAELVTLWYSSDLRGIYTPGVNIPLRFDTSSSVCEIKGRNDGWSSWNIIFNTTTLAVCCSKHQICYWTYCKNEHQEEHSVKLQLILCSFLHCNCSKMGKVTFFFVFMTKASRQLI